MQQTTLKIVQQEKLKRHNISTKCERKEEKKINGISTISFIYGFM